MCSIGLSCGRVNEPPRGSAPWQHGQRLQPASQTKNQIDTNRRRKETQIFAWIDLEGAGMDVITMILWRQWVALRERFFRLKGACPPQRRERAAILGIRVKGCVGAPLWGDPLLRKQSQWKIRDMKNCEKNWRKKLLIKNCDEENQTRKISNN